MHIIKHRDAPVRAILDITPESYYNINITFFHCVSVAGAEYWYSNSSTNWASRATRTSRITGTQGRSGGLFYWFSGKSRSSRIPGF